MNSMLDWIYRLLGIDLVLQSWGFSGYCSSRLSASALDADPALRIAFGPLTDQRAS